MCYIRIKQDLISVKVPIIGHFLFCISFIKKVNLRKMTFKLVPSHYVFNTFCLKVACCIKEQGIRECFRVIAFG